jgi:transcriptional regulator with XRE-family HTH domain
MREKRRSTVARDVSDDTKKTVGETLKQLRQEKLWSQAELASRIKTTTMSVGRWEKNITRPSLHFQQKLCAIFGKSPEELGFLPKSEHEEDPERNDQQQEIAPDKREKATIPRLAKSSFPFLANVPLTPLRRALILRNIVSRRRRSFLFATACLSIFLLLSSVFLYRQNTLSSPSHLPSCQAPSSHESAAAIYDQVMCKQPLLSFAMDQQDALQWDENEQCAFTHGAYHVLLSPTAYVSECFAHITPPLHNFALQVEMTVLKGYSGGLVFHAEGPSSNWDVITSRIPIDIWGQYNFDLANTTVPCHLTKNTSYPNYCQSPHGTITYGTGVTNTMTVIALGSLIYFYVNSIFIDQAKAPASSPSTGFIGVFANGSQVTADVAFRQIKMWKI